MLLTGKPQVSSSVQNDSLRLPEEKHLLNIKQLSFGGENAEAYFSADGQQLIFQSTRDGHGCDQIYTMNLDGSNVKMDISAGETTASYAGTIAGNEMTGTMTVTCAPGTGKGTFKLTKQ